MPGSNSNLSIDEK
jgi:hypothetical protein